MEEEEEEEEEKRKREQQYPSFSSRYQDFPIEQDAKIEAGRESDDDVLYEAVEGPDQTAAKHESKPPRYSQVMKN